MSAPLVGRLSGGSQILNTAKEIWRLYGHPGQIIQIPKAGEIRGAVRSIGELMQTASGRLQIGLDDLSVMGMNQAGDGDLLAFSDPNAHGKGFRQCRGTVVDGGIGHLHAQSGSGDKAAWLV